MTDKQLAAERDFKARVAALNARLSPSDKTYQGEYAKAKAEALAKAE
jgi:hypothetical protein